MVTGKKRFAEFLESPERITTNVLTDRLTRLEAAGLVTRSPYQQRPPRYDYILTDQGQALLPIMREMCRWANRVNPDTWIPPDSFMCPPEC
jgi:DNA-binding HxlR family transcriptional regulator